MNLIETLTIIDDLNKKLDGVKEWLSTGNNNYFVVIVFFVGLIVFGLTYKSLNNR